LTSAYHPEPPPLDDSALPPELAALIEVLAERNHDLWAAERMAEGWRYGPRRSDELKQHPLLVPYAQLPESEKDYDRRPVIDVLKQLLQRGYRIVPPTAAATSINTTASFNQLLARLESAERIEIRALLQIWQTRNPEEWRAEPALYRALGKRFARREPLIAHEVLSEGVRALSEPDPELAYLLVRALADAGALEQASTMVRELKVEGTSGQLREDILSLPGRVAKDQAAHARSSKAQRAYRRAAADAYRHAFEQTGGSFSGVNAATLMYLLQEGEASAALREQAHRAAILELGRNRRAGASTEWQRATLGELALLRGRWERARRHYRVASDSFANAGRWVDIASMKRQARMIAELQGRTREQIDAMFAAANVIVFSGHMIDGEHHQGVRFPVQLERRIARTIEQKLERIDARFGFAAAASGGDILFLEAMLARGGEITVVLPYARARFLETSVTASGNWRARFERVLERAKEVVEIPATPEPTPEVFEYANLFMLGLAAVRAREVAGQLLPLVLWDGRRSGSGVARAVKQWRKLPYGLDIIPLPHTDP
jgi:hypothetical protein